jgi:drug/metabolite transporter (DMT)-like permease
VLTLAEPLTALGVAALVWGETLGVGALAGAALVLGAAYLVVRDEAAVPIHPQLLDEARAESL